MRDADTPPMTVEGRRVGVRPHSWVRRLSRGLFGLLTGTFAAMMVLSWIYPGGSREAPSWALISLGLSFFATVAVAAGALAAQAACWVGPLSRRAVSASAEGVRVSGGRLIPRDAIESAWTLREPDGTRVELGLRSGDVFTTTAATAEEANALLDAAQVDPSRRALRMPLGGAAMSIGVGLASAIPAACVSSITAVLAEGLLHLPSAAMGFLMFALFTVLVGGAVRLLSPPVVSVGRDGLSVSGGYSSWFVAFRDVGDVIYGRNELTLLLRDGRVRRISTLSTTVARREALHARIAAGVEALRAPPDLSTRLAALDRNGRTAEEWRKALGELSLARDDYRHTGLTRDEVQAALDDPATSPERRVGAAYALAAMDQTQGPTRVRIAAETVAHEPVRAAMERAAGGELDDDSVEAVTSARERG